jgi:hypothetical protein
VPVRINFYWDSVGKLHPWKLIFGSSSSTVCKGYGYLLLQQSISQLLDEKVTNIYWVLILHHV